MTTAPLAAVPPELNRDLAAVLMRHGYAMPEVVSADRTTRIVERFVRAVAELVNAYVDTPPFEGATASAPAVRQVVEVTHLDLVDNRNVVTTPGGHVRFVLGAQRFPLTDSVVQRAAWIALDAATVEVTGDGPGTRWFTDALTRSLAEQWSAAHP